MGQNLVAIDLGAKVARVVVIEAFFRKASLIAAHTVPIDAGQDRAALLAKVRAILPQQVDAVIMTADPGVISTRLLTFPFGDVRKVEAALDFELENQVPYDLESLVTAWTINRQTNHQSQVLAAVAPREAVLQNIKAAAAVGLEPRAVLMPAASLASLSMTSENQATAILSIGETFTHLAIMKNGLQFARSIRAGGGNVDRVLARCYNLSLEDARQAKEAEGRLGADSKNVSSAEQAAIAAISEGFGPLIRGLVASLRSLPGDLMPTKVYLTGGSSRLPGLTDFLSSKLSLPVELLDLQQSLGDITLSLESLGPEFSVATGAAMALFRNRTGVMLNFRNRELAYQGDMRVYRGELVRVGIGLAMVFILAIAGSVVRYSLISAEESRINRSFCEATKRIVGREICDPTAALATMRQTPAVGEGLVIPPYSATGLLELVSRVVEPSVDVTFEDLEIRVTGRLEDPDRLTARGEAASFETTEEIISRLKNNPCVKEAEVSKQRKTRDASRVEFNLTAKLSCPAGVQPAMPETTPSKIEVNVEEPATDEQTIN